MKIPRQCCIEKVASKDKNRRVLNHPYLDMRTPGQSLIVATDGKAMVILKTQVSSDDTSGPISIDAIKAARKIKSDTFTANGAHVLPNGMLIPRPTQEAGHEYPNWRQLLPSSDRKPIASIVINPQLLIKVAEALGSEEEVSLHIFDEEDAILVGPSLSPPYAYCEDGSFGIFMPKRRPYGRPPVPHLSVLQPPQPPAQAVAPASSEVPSPAVKTPDQPGV